ncbi:opioid growth factor receptor-like protein 1 isoform X1 [Ixodes scapularis]
MGGGQSSQKQFYQFKKLRKEQALREMEIYREHYPDDVDDLVLNENYRFYLNELASRPDGILIEDMLSQWWGKYDILETNHDYMPWLFPTRGKSTNPACQRLQLHEAQSMKQDPVVQARLIRSYKMMLDFFGLELLDEAKGVVDKAPHWEIRFLNLNRLFPTRGKSTNPACQRLQLHEAQSMKQDPVVQARLIRSYKMMLDFFGLELLDEAKGVVDKAPHWEIRFLNLNRFECY